jgi:predicted Zn-dependent protease
VNAFAIPGDHVYVFDGLIDKANTPDELAGVIARQTRPRRPIAPAVRVLL